MKLLRENWKAIVGITVLYVLLGFLVAFLITNNILDSDTNRALNRANAVSLSPSAIGSDIAILPGTTNSAAAKTLRSGAAYAREIKANNLVVTIAVHTNGEISRFIQVTDTRTPTGFTMGVIAFMASLLYAITIYGLLRRALRMRDYRAMLVAKVRNIERSPLTQNYIITKNDDQVTTAINHLGEAIQQQIISNSETKQNLYEFIEFFQFPIFVYDGKGSIHRANAAFQNEFGEQPSIDIFSPYPDFLSFLVEKMVRPDIQNKTFYFEAMASYYEVHFNPLVHINNRYLVSMNDVSQYQQIVTAHNDFIANVSHEFKTPLVSIRGFAELLSEAPELKKASKRQAKLIQQESERLMALVSDTLLLTQQNPRIVHQSVSLSNLTASILENFSGQIKEKSLKVSSNLTDITIKSDETKIHAIFKNLIENALIYTPEKGQISVSLVPAANHVQFSVTDNGPGLSELERQRIFERFYRTETGDVNPQGTGLGLAIVQKNVQDLGGHIEVRSKEGEGTSFIVSLKA
ncbi:MAG: HAMP domain-containing histidine kinase [Streptococcaceae bacterium]|jgi:two-component system OmpR family sensor kinase|nr:HAMP domain-containing histidine kinase [Streptococcaceae bacterium]